MADEFQTGICSGSSWWNSMRTSGLDATAAASAVSATVSSVSCSTAIDDVGGYGWAPAAESKTRSCEESSVSCSSVNFQDSQKVPVSVPMVSAGFLMDPSLPLASGYGMDWNNQALMSSSGGRAESTFHALLHEELSSSKPYFNQEAAAAAVEDSTANLFKDMNQAFILDQQHLSSGNNDPAATDSVSNTFPAVSASYGCPSMFLQGLFEQDIKPQQPPYDHNSYRISSNELSAQSSWFIKSSPPPQPTLPKQQPGGQLHFSNNTPFWNAPPAAVANELRPSFYAPAQTQFLAQNYEGKPNISGITTKPNSEGARDSSSATTSKKTGNEPAFKKPRMETPSPLPTFKVRKEKLGDRITALQQLVSPFGKTDTASVLYEAIEYIKFLHDQVNVLSTPYLKNNGHPMQQQQNSEKLKDGDGPKQDLRSRGLCLVPISSTFPVANEQTADLWTPTFGGSYR